MSKILVVDDETSIINLLTSYLKADGYEVFTAPLFRLGRSVKQERFSSRKNVISHTPPEQVEHHE